MNQDDKLFTNISNNISSIKDFQDLYIKVFLPIAFILLIKTIHYFGDKYMEKYGKKSIEKRDYKKRLATALENHISKVESTMNSKPATQVQVADGPITIMDIKPRFSM